MKHLVLSLALAILGLVAISPVAMAQKCQQTILSGCFGECGGKQFIGSFTAHDDGEFAVFTATSLCGSLGLVVEVSINGDVSSTIAFNDEVVTFEADDDDEVTVTVRNWRTDPRIFCIRQGEVFVDVCSIDDDDDSTSSTSSSSDDE